MEGKYLSGKIRAFDLKKTMGKGPRKIEETVKMVKDYCLLGVPIVDNYSGRSHLSKSNKLFPAMP